jgi:hypothetical protein
MAIFGTYYLNAPSLASATSVYTDAALTTVAPDGIYSDGVQFRNLVLGVFEAFVATCSGCPTPCSLTPININDEGAKTYYVQQDVGSTILDTGAIIVEITFNSNEYPLGIFFMYDGNIYRTFSCQNVGRVSIISTSTPEFIYIGRSLFDCGIVGSPYNAVAYTYNPVTNSFTTTGSSTIITPDVSQYSLSFPSPGKYVMVIPKTSPAANIIEYIAAILCPSITNVDISIKCPAALPSFTSTEDYALSIDACGAGTFQTYYSADVNGTTSSGGFFGLYDWVFFDSFGQTILPDGWYRSPSCPSPYDLFEVQDGVIISFDTCASYPEWTIDYEVENAILGPCNATIVNLFLEISQPPFPSYVNNNAPSTGSVLVPEGITHIQLRAEYDNRFVSCGSQFKLVIERNGVIIASKTYTPVLGYEYLDVDINLDNDASIYGYITLA